MAFILFGITVLVVLWHLISTQEHHDRRLRKLEATQDAGDGAST